MSVIIIVIGCILLYYCCRGFVLLRAVDITFVIVMVDVVAGDGLFHLRLNEVRRENVAVVVIWA